MNQGFIGTRYITCIMCVDFMRVYFCVAIDSIPHSSPISQLVKLGTVKIAQKGLSDLGELEAQARELVGKLGERRSSLLSVL